MFSIQFESFISTFQYQQQQPKQQQYHEIKIDFLKIE